MTMAAEIAGAGGRETTNLRLAICWFETAEPKGPAFGDPENTTWGAFTDVFSWRREGEKDGPNFVPARFTLESDGRQVRRLGRNVLTRTAIALDVETNKHTGEVPPTLDTAMRRIAALGLAGLGYHSHSHRPDADRYRLILPVDHEVAPDLPAVEIIAERLGLMGVIDMSKRNPASLFYLPSRPYDIDYHETIIFPGAPVEAAWLETAGGAILAARQAEADRIAAEAHAEAAKRLQARLAAGFDPDDSLIEKLRQRLDLDSVLRSHGYDTAKSGAGTKYRHPNSESGSYGADIKNLGGIERVYSHNAGDPLHHSNFLAWCTVTAIDVFDVVTILDFGGDRPRALSALADRFGFSKTEERKVVSRLIFRLMRQGATAEHIRREAFAEGVRQGLTQHDVLSVAVWVKNNCRRAA
jgi:hypothetical protein